MDLTMVILLMAVVTAIPRLLPVFVSNSVSFPGWFKKWLQSIPYAVLGALIFPAVIYIEQGKPIIGVLGAGAALFLAAKGYHVIYVVFASITVVLVSKLLF